MRKYSRRMRHACNPALTGCSHPEIEQRAPIRAAVPSTMAVSALSRCAAAATRKIGLSSQARSSNGPLHLGPDVEFGPGSRLPLARSASRSLWSSLPQCRACFVQVRWFRTQKGGVVGEAKTEERTQAQARVAGRDVKYIPGSSRRPDMFAPCKNPGASTMGEYATDVMSACSASSCRKLAVHSPCSLEILSAEVPQPEIQALPGDGLLGRVGVPFDLITDRGADEVGSV